MWPGDSLTDCCAGRLVLYAGLFPFPPPTPRVVFPASVAFQEAGSCFPEARLWGSRDEAASRFPDGSPLLSLKSCSVLLTFYRFIVLF